MKRTEFSRRDWALSVLAILAAVPRQALARPLGMSTATAVTPLSPPITPPPNTGSAAPGTPPAQPSSSPTQPPAPAAPPSPPPSAQAPAAAGSISGRLKTVPPKAARWGVVYLENAPLDKPVPGKLQSTVKMKFVPFLQVMTKGEKLTYVNTAPFPDNATSPSEEKWDFGMVGPGGVRVRTMQRAGAYTVLCQIHPQELAFVMVSPSSYFAMTDAKGAFSIPNVPQATYEVVAWAPRMKPERQTVVVKGDETVEFSLKR